MCFLGLQTNQDHSRETDWVIVLKHIESLGVGRMTPGVNHDHGGVKSAIIVPKIGGIHAYV